MKQFHQAKKIYPDCIIFFRLGDFYEMFEDDAIIASQILGLQLTSRNKNSKNPIPLCGIPHHSYAPYLKKLIDAGKKVAICEQLEDPKDAIGIVKRGVVKVITAATNIDNIDAMSYDNNFLVALSYQEDKYFVAIADISTGELYLKSINKDILIDSLNLLDPKEILVDLALELDGFNIQLRPVSINQSRIKDTILKHFDLQSLDKSFPDDEFFFTPIYMILQYIDDLIIRTKLSLPILLSDDDNLIIDSIAVKTLELIPDKSKSNRSLFDILNKCSTSMGSRYLKFAILNPSRNVDIINNRYSLIERFIETYDLTETIQALLKNSIDLFRVSTRIFTGSVSPKDLIGLKSLLQKIPEIQATLLDIVPSTYIDINLQPIDDLAKLIDDAINDNSSNKVGDGSVIKYGFNNLLDEIADLKKNVDKELLAIEQKEKKASGIGQLKIGYNKVFGYYFEVSKSNMNRVPAYFERKQTLVNAERFFTTELKVLENSILSAEERVAELEKKIFADIRDYAKSKIVQIRELADNISRLDFLISLSTVAKENNYCKPIIHDGYDIHISDARHPIVEQELTSSFIPNDFIISESNRLMIITGPNMSGKSTYLRSIAVISIMAHIGSYVPASYCKIATIDRIFTRIGASDNISKGESTFMVEMLESANIIRNATDRSLIILDEVGRGTSTYDGISLATAIADYLLNRVRAKTLFATHYHELASISDRSDGAESYRVDVKEWNDEVVFLHKVVKGTSDKSYGIYVAKLATLPDEIISTANKILKKLETERIDELIHNNDNGNYDNKQTQNISDPLTSERLAILDSIRSINTDTITPLDALNILIEYKNRIGNL